VLHSITEVLPDEVLTLIRWAVEEAVMKRRARSRTLEWVKARKQKKQRQRARTLDYTEARKEQKKQLNRATKSAQKNAREKLSAAIKALQESLDAVQAYYDAVRLVEEFPPQNDPVILDNLHPPWMFDVYTTSPVLSKISHVLGQAAAMVDAQAEAVAALPIPPARTNPLDTRTGGKETKLGHPESAALHEAMSTIEGMFEHQCGQPQALSRTYAHAILYTARLIENPDPSSRCSKRSSVRNQPTPAM
jgi:hypothetical protein